MTPVSADDVARQQAKWKASQESQDDLLKEKAELDQERARLEAERNRLIQDAGNLDDERERIAQLERSATTAEGPIAGPFTLYTGQFSNTRGSKDREYDGFADARAAGEKHMSERSSSQPNYRIADKSGTDIEYDGLFGRKKVSTARIQQSNAKPDPANDPATVVARRKGGLANSQRDRRDRADAYKSDLAKYQQRLEAYQQKLATHKKEINTWGDDQYRGPKPAASKSR